MAGPSYTYTLTNGTTADASQVMQNFNDILNGVTDGTKDLSIAAITAAGTATFNGNVNIGNASGDDLTVTASLASTIPVKTNTSYDIGSATLGLRSVYIGGTSSFTTRILGAATATYTITLPVDAGTNTYVPTNTGSGTLSWLPPGGSMTSGSDADTTLTVASNRFYKVTPTAARAYTLPTTSVLAGDVFYFYNAASVSSSNLFLTIKASGGTTAGVVYPQTMNGFRALQDTPTTSAHWVAVSAIESQWTDYTLTIGGSSSAPTQGSGATKTARGRRVGDTMEIQFDYAQTAAGANGSGTYLFPLWQAATIDSAKIKIDNDTMAGTCGSCSLRNSGNFSYGNVQTYNSTNLAITVGDSAALLSYVGSANNGLGTTTIYYSFFARVPISGWESHRG